MAIDATNVSTNLLSKVLHKHPHSNRRMNPDNETRLYGVRRLQLRFYLTRDYICRMIHEHKKTHTLIVATGGNKSEKKGTIDTLTENMSRAPNAQVRLFQNERRATVYRTPTLPPDI